MDKGFCGHKGADIQNFFGNKGNLVDKYLSLVDLLQLNKRMRLGAGVNIVAVVVGPNVGEECRVIIREKFARKSCARSCVISCALVAHCVNGQSNRVVQLTGGVQAAGSGRVYLGLNNLTNV